MATQKVTYVFHTERDTKNFRRFKAEEGELGVIYIKNEDLKKIGSPASITITVTAV